MPVAATPVVEAVVDELRAVVTVEADQGHRQAVVHVLDGAADADSGPCPRRRRARPSRWRCRRRRGYRGRSPRCCCRSGRRDRPRRSPGRASSHSVKVRMGMSCLQPGARGRGGGAAAGVLRAGRGEQAGERGAAGLAQALVDAAAQGQVAALGEPIEELGEKGVEAMGADAAAGLPQDRRPRRRRRPRSAGGGRRARARPAPGAPGAAAGWRPCGGCRRRRRPRPRAAASRRGSRASSARVERRRTPEGWLASRAPPRLELVTVTSDLRALLR